MLTDIQPYPVYKPSGVEWLGDVPEHWEVTRLKVQLSRNDSGVWGGDFSDTGTVVVRSTEQTLTGRWAISSPARINLSPRDVAAALLKRGDLVVTKSSGSQAHIGKTTLVESKVEQLQCCFSNFMQRLRLNANTLPKLTWYTLNSPIGREQLVYQSTSTSGLGNLNGTILGNCVFPLPPLPEQAAIVRYLDYVDRRIRRYVTAKERLVGLLEEEKQAVITRAVTRGLDPNVPLKPSGVEWLGDVPEHWDVLQLGRVIDLATGSPFKSERFSFATDDIRLLRGINISLGRLRWRDIVRWPKTDCSAYAEYRMEIGDIALGMDRPFIEGGVRAASVSESDVPALLLQRVARIRCRQELSSEFTLLLLTAKSFANYLKPLSTGISVPHVSPEQIKSYRIALPSIRDQNEIVQHVMSETRSIQLRADRVRRQIDLIQEYRTRLIADVVTGKLDVRAAAARLPNETDDRDPIDESGRLAENVDGSVRDANEAVGELATAGEVTV